MLQLTGYCVFMQLRWSIVSQSAVAMRFLSVTRLDGTKGSRFIQCRLHISSKLKAISMSVVLLRILVFIINHIAGATFSTQIMFPSWGLGEPWSRSRLRCFCRRNEGSEPGNVQRLNVGQNLSAAAAAAAARL